MLILTRSVKGRLTAFAPAVFTRLLPTALLALALLTTTRAIAAGTSTFTGGPGVTIPDQGSGSPFPSILNVSGTDGVISDVNVTLTNLNHAIIRDIVVMLESPSGSQVRLMGRVGTDAAFSGTLTLDDQATDVLDELVAIPSGGGSFRPGGRNPTDPFPGVRPSETGPFGSTLSALNGVIANGTWRLFIIDPVSGDAGSLDSWSLTITTVPPPPATVVSLAATVPGPQNGANISWQIIFDVPISGLTAANFTAVPTGLGGTPTVTGIGNLSGALFTTTWNIGVSTGTGDGTLGVNLVNDTGLSHTVTNLPFAGVVRIIDKTPPSFTSITRFTPLTENTSASTLVFRAVFNEIVTNVNAADFSVVGGSTATITGVSGSGSQYDITVSGGDLSSFTGTVGLDLAAGHNIKDPAGNALPTTEPATDETYNLTPVTVSIAATDADADENTAGTGTWRITRNGTVGALTVHLAIDASSSASATDWTQSGATFASRAPGSTGTATIAAGNSFVDIVLTPTADLHAEAAETVRLNITTDAAYTVGSPADATVTIGQNDFHVTNTNDAGEGSLRQAIANANAIPGADTITFSDGTGGTTDYTDNTPDTITLGGTELVINSSLTIAGPGADKLTVSGNNASRVFSISSGSNVVTLSGLTITGGRVTGIYGGGIASGSTNTVTVTQCVLSGNSADAGAAIYSAGSLTVALSALSSNTADFGGAIFFESTGNLIVTQSTLTGHTVTYNGGAITNNSTGSVTVTQSTFSSNAAAGYGGCIFNNTTGSVSVIQSTLSGNSAFRGGGIHNNSTGSVTVANTIIAGNSPGGDVRGSAFTSNGKNFIGDTTNSTGFVATDKTFASTGITLAQLIGPLANNGGLTQTFALVSGSPAINAGDNASIPADTFDLDGDLNTTEPLPFDQRGSGFARTVGTVDIGAFEHPLPVDLEATTSSAAEGTGAGTTTFTFTVSRPGPTTDAVTLDYAVTGTGTNPANAADFGGTLPTGTVTLGAGVASNTITISVSKDTLVEPDETFTLTLSNPTAGHAVAGLGVPSTITNDDSATISIAKINNGNEGPPIVNGLFRLTMTAASSTATSVSYSIGGTATAGSDYSTLSGTVSIPAGLTSADISVTVLADAVSGEPIETVIATLTSTDNASITVGTPTSATVDILSGPRPVPTAFGDVVTNASATDATGAADGTEFDVLGRGGYLAANGTLGVPGSLKIGVGGVTEVPNNFQAYWKDNGSGLKRLVRSGDVAPGTNGALFNAIPTIPVPGLNPQGLVTLLSGLRIGSGSPAVTSADDSAMWSEVGGNGLQLLMRENDPVPGISGGLVASFGFGCYATANTGATTGEAVFAIKMKGTSTDSVLLRQSITGPGTASVSIVAREKTAAPGAGGELFGALHSTLGAATRMDTLGNIVFEGQIRPSGKYGIWYQPVVGSLSKVFIAGEAAPATSSATFSTFEMPSMGSSGTFAFVGYLNADGDNTANDKNNGIWRGTLAGGILPILRRGDAALPGMVVGSKVGHLWSGWLNQNNRGAWRGWIDTAGDGVSAFPADTYGIYTDAGGTMRLLLSVNDIAPGTGGATLASVDHPVISGATTGNEHVAFLGTLSGAGVTAGNAKAIWRSDNGAAPVLLLRTGDSMTTSTGDKIVANIDMPGTNMDIRPWELPVMDNNGRVLMVITFTDGTTAQVIAP